MKEKLQRNENTVDSVHGKCIYDILYDIYIYNINTIIYHYHKYHYHHI